MANARGDQLTKILTASDIGEFFEIPPEWSTLLALPRRLDVPHRLCVIDGFGFFWEFRCTEFPELFTLFGTTLTLKCRFGFGSFEWQRFVAHKRLRVGDRLVIEAKEPGFMEVGFRLRAQRLFQDQRFCFYWRDV